MRAHLTDAFDGRRAVDWLADHGELVDVLGHAEAPQSLTGGVEADAE